MPKISVIIPVYNVEKYLSQALESVINQTFADLEIVCVNDGSTDNSLKILKEYAQKDERIIVFTQVNQGVSAARNKGIDNATGEYIMFLDPDDTYDLTLCEKVVHKIDTENPDIVMWGHNKVCKGEVVDADCYIEGLSYLKKCKKAAIEKYIVLQVYVWDKAFKKSFLFDNGIKFALGLKQAEDLIFCLLTFYGNPKYSYIPEVLSFYTDFRSDSATANYRENIKNDMLAYKHLYSLEEFQKQSQKVKIISTQHFLGGSIYYWKVLKDNSFKDQYYQDVLAFLNVVEGHFNYKELSKMSNYRKLKHLLFKYKNRAFFNLFDIRTTKTENTYVFCGKKLTVKRR